MKRKIISIIALISFTLVLSTVVLGYYIFTKTQTGSVTIGDFSSPTVRYFNDSALITSTNNAGYESATNTLKCYASQKQSYDNLNYAEFCNVSSTVTFSSTIDTRLRIKLNDSWQSYKVTGSGTETSTVITKDYNASTSEADLPFQFAKNGNEALWTFDIASGYVYYNNIIEANNNVSLVFLDTSTYYYELSQTTLYHESIFLILTLSVEIVQANRAETIWGVTF